MLTRSYALEAGNLASQEMLRGADQAMAVRHKLKYAGLGLLVCVIAMPAAFLITLFTFPLWRWFEASTGIESYGHHGPADWCYWFVYAVLIVIAAWLRYLALPGKRNN